MARGYAVFNAAQVGRYEPPPAVIMPPSVRTGRAKDFFASLEAAIRRGGNRAYFQPMTGHIQMPLFEAFLDALPITPPSAMKPLTGTA